ncbi:hypothetical protein D9M69_648500 [compost metagenome]
MLSDLLRYGSPSRYSPSTPLCSRLLPRVSRVGSRLMWALALAISWKKSFGEVWVRRAASTISFSACCSSLSCSLLSRTQTWKAGSDGLVRSRSAVQAVTSCGVRVAERRPRKSMCMA